MQRSIGISLALTAMITLSVVFDRQGDASLSEKKNPFTVFSQQTKFVGKPGTSFSPKVHFTWVDQASGRGRAIVELVSQSFVSGPWQGSWVLPPGTSTQDSLLTSFESSGLDSNAVFEIEVEGLKFTENENIILQVKPADRSEGAMAVVIPTNYQETLESQMSSHLEKETFGQLKMLNSGSRIHKGIQF
jgi:hypothetical protein